MVMQPQTPAAGDIEGRSTPLTVEVGYMADVLSVVDGGIERGTRYLDNLHISTEVDLERALGWDGATANVQLLYNNGRSISELAGDTQAISNIEAEVRAVRLYEAWIDQRMGEDISLRIGLYDLNSEFDALDTSSLFLNGSHGIGHDIGQTGENGPSIFPYTSFGARLDMEVAPDWIVRLAVLDGVPGDPNRPRATTISLGNGDGALMIGELQAPLPDGKLLVGHWRYDAGFERFDGSMGEANDGWYLRGEHRLTTEPYDAAQGLAGFLRFGIADERYNEYSRYVGGGLVYTGLLPGRDEDEAGLAVSAAFASDRFRQVSVAESAEIAIEATYNAGITEWLSIQPNLQYIINPSADPAIDNAVVFGFRIEIGAQIFGAND